MFPPYAIILKNPMSREAALIWSAMNVLNIRRYQALCEAYRSLEYALGSLNAGLLMKLGCGTDAAVRALGVRRLFDVCAYGESLNNLGIQFITIEEDAYPRLLRETSDPPPFLYALGSLEILDHMCIACVGTRAMSAYGKRSVQRFVPAFVSAGITTVSGLAYGIDTAVALETLAAGGKTVAVLGHGLRDIFPHANRKLAERIVAGGGLLLSEYPLDTTPDTFTFPARNRIIAGLAQATIIFEAGEASGALYTADFALEDGRDVFAVPGQIFDPNYEGCNTLISQSAAMLVSEPQDVLCTLGIDTVPKTSRGDAARPAFADANEAAVFVALGSMPKSPGDLVELLALDAATVNAKLTVLELRGLAKDVGSHRWVREGCAG